MSKGYKRFDVVLADLPVQNVSKDNPNTGRKFIVAGTELCGLHPVVIMHVNDSGIIGIPLTSAQDSFGAEKWHVWKKSWARVLHNGRYHAALCEQVRYIASERIHKNCGSLGCDDGGYDQKQIMTKVQSLFELL